MKKLLIAFGLFLALVSCGSDDKTEDNNRTEYAGKWVVQNVSYEVEADTEETKTAIINLLTSQSVKTGTYLKLEYINAEKSYEYDYRDIVTNSTPGGEMYFKDGKFVPRYEGPSFSVSFQYLYYENDYKDFYLSKEGYPDIKKAVQKIFFKKE